MRLAAIKAIEDARLTGAAPKLIEIARRRRRKRESERAAAVKALRVLGDKRAVAPDQDAARRHSTRRR